MLEAGRIVRCSRRTTCPCPTYGELAQENIVHNYHQAIVGCRVDDDRHLFKSKSYLRCNHNLAYPMATSVDSRNCYL